MKRSFCLSILGGLVIAAACSDSSSTSAPTPPIAGDVSAEVGNPPTIGVGTLGTLDEVKPQEQGLVLYQTGFDYVPPPGAKYEKVEHEFKVGSRHNKLQVHIGDSTRIYLRGEVKKLSDLVVGTPLLVVGRVTGSALHADLITDLADLGPPPADVSARLPKDLGRTVSNPRVSAALPAGPLSLCMGQDLDYTNAHILEFQGCWGGPSASDDINTPFIPLFCPLIGCFGMDRVSYTMALGGWNFAFPFQFDTKATSGLTYHVPGDVSLQMAGLPATTGSFSFSGGLGLDIGLNIDFCSLFGCYDIYTFHLSAFSMIHEATGAGPLTGQYMEIAETSCPSIGIIPIEGIPIDPLSVGLCEDLGMDGRAFNAMVRSSGASPAIARWIAFGPSAETVRVRPDSMSVRLRYEQFAWSPQLDLGLFFRFKIFNVPIYSTPTIPFTSGPFDAVTTPFPQGPFTVATDPLSPVDDLRYLYQPTYHSATLAVAPAATTLTLTSGTLLTEGSPVTARLVESYDGSPIVGRPVSIEASGLGGTSSVSLVGTTDANGVASVLLPVGEYDVTARYAGAEMYLPSTASLTPVYVYRPTTFVIWGGESGGIAVGARYQFWGSGWWRQATTGSYTANASFLGYAIPVSAVQWVSPPANAGRGPASVPDLIGVIITTQVAGRGSGTTGNIAGGAVLRVVDPAGYRPDGGHDSWGVVKTLLP